MASAMTHQRHMARVGMASVAGLFRVSLPAVPYGQPFAPLVCRVRH
jgi:hypothetical protein